MFPDFLLAVFAFAGTVYGGLLVIFQKVIPAKFPDLRKKLLSAKAIRWDKYVSMTLFFVAGISIVSWLIWRVVLSYL